MSGRPNWKIRDVWGLLARTPKMSLGGPQSTKKSQREPQGRPKVAQWSPKGPKETPKKTQRETKGGSKAHGMPKGTQETPKSTQKTPMTSQRRPMGAPRVPKRANTMKTYENTMVFHCFEGGQGPHRPVNLISNGPESTLKTICPKTMFGR